MVVRKEINGLIFIAQTTYYVYKSKEDIENNSPTVCTSDTEVFNQNIRLAEENQSKNNPNKFVVMI